MVMIPFDDDKPGSCIWKLSNDGSSCNVNYNNFFEIELTTSAITFEWQTVVIIY